MRTMQLWRQQGQRCEARRLHNVAALYARAAQQPSSPVFHAQRCLATSGEGPSPPSASSPKSKEGESAEPASRQENLSRLRELLRETSLEDGTALFFKPHLPRRKELWPTLRRTSPPIPEASPQGNAVAATSDLQDHSATAIRATPPPPARSKENCSPRHRDPLCWYGGPPGVIRDVDYFTAGMAGPFSTFFRTQYYLKNQPTAPLLRCPACAAQLLSAKEEKGSVVQGVQGSDPRTPTSSRLWMDPPTLDRHLSWAHPDQLYCPQELAAYNDQVLREILYNCGLASAAACGVDRDAEEPLEEWKAAPARLILAVDVANVEIGASTKVLDMLTSEELHRVFAQVPVVICAAHELLVPFASRIPHVLYQLARLHPSSTLHFFVANTSLESGDLMMSSFLNELMLASCTREIPPVVLLTRDGQQRQVANEMHGSGQRTLSPMGVIRFSSSGVVANFAEELRAALTGGLWKV
ncbi:hypothetical protein ABL78_3684 [Leptomonas seymouri]|uniref:Uncharacterized protein n=1 Tax=Leptomonas seymouri TaxID=5684 RepID=A0A0N1I7E4_LEPSE|nr:hypothetical protein ABL78_3684 [Leptomonas seymouri]|eukprot:KPI87214.1 hypothetical protein ABL78_3684 [Leptomonas seymouri]